MKQTFPLSFGGECDLTATYIINQLPSKIIGDKTPYEVLFGHQPEYDHMRVFGCLAYYKNNETNGDKFEPRGKLEVFLGYPPGKKGYKIYDLEQRKMMMTRDVKFIEDIFPFSKTESKNIEEEIFEDLNPISQYDEPHEDLTENVVTGGDSANNNEETHNMESIFEEQPESSVEEEQGMQSNSTHDEDIHIENHVEPPVIQQEIEEERQRRQRKQPGHLRDYQVRLPPSIDHTQPVSSQASSTVHPLSHYVSFEQFSNTHKAFLYAINNHDEPKHFHQAAQNEN